MNMTPCVECEEWCIFENMNIAGYELYCDECFERIFEDWEESE